MNSYWLSRTGESDAEGPYTEQQLIALWKSGQVTAWAEVCRTGKNKWRPLSHLVSRRAFSFHRMTVSMLTAAVLTVAVVGGWNMWKRWQEIRAENLGQP